MKYLLDTDTVINHLRGKKEIDPTIIAAGVGVSIITYGELLYGAYKSANKDKTFEIIKLFIEGLGVDIIGLTTQAMERFGQIKAMLEKKGERIADFDLLIGVTALVSNASLITQNKKYFKRIPHIAIVG